MSERPELLQNRTGLRTLRRLAFPAAMTAAAFAGGFKAWQEHQTAPAIEHVLPALPSECGSPAIAEDMSIEDQLRAYDRVRAEENARGGSDQAIIDRVAARTLTCTKAQRYMTENAARRAFNNGDIAGFVTRVVN